MADLKSHLLNARSSITHFRSVPKIRTRGGMKRSHGRGQEGSVIREGRGAIQFILALQLLLLIANKSSINDLPSS